MLKRKWIFLGLLLCSGLTWPAEKDVTYEELLRPHHPKNDVLALDYKQYHPFLMKPIYSHNHDPMLDTRDLYVVQYGTGTALTGQCSLRVFLKKGEMFQELYSEYSDDKGCWGLPDMFHLTGRDFLFFPFYDRSGEMENSHVYYIDEKNFFTPIDIEPLMKRKECLAKIPQELEPGGTVEHSFQNEIASFEMRVAYYEDEFDAYGSDQGRVHGTYRLILQPTKVPRKKFFFAIDRCQYEPEKKEKTVLPGLEDE